MKKQTLNISTYIAFIGLFALISACDSNSTSSGTTVETNYALSMVSGAGDVNTTFLQGMPNLDMTEIDNSNSTELAQYASIFTDGNSLFVPGFGAPATMGKYIFNDAGQAELDEQIIIPGSNTFSTIEILNPTLGYATVGGGISRVVKFDPSSMRITGEIDISDVGDGFFYADLIVRDNNLFVALNDFGSSGSAHVAVIDIAADTLQKVITDARTSTLLGSTNTTVFAIDTNGDILVHGTGLFSEYSGSGKTPSGILKIKNGETEFDQDYFFNLTAATGYTTTYGLYHFGDGLTFTTISDNDANFFGSDGDNPSFRYHRLNLTNNTSEGDIDTDLPNTFAASRTMFMVQLSDQEILFPIAGANEDALYSFDIANKTVSKKMDSNSGFISGLVQLNQE